MYQPQLKQDSLFNLIKNMTKAEKRNFKLFATRQEANSEALFIALFNVLDSLEVYDETKILKKCLIKKSQLPNMKAHLYRQILVSIRLIDVHHNPVIQLREQIDFAKILYDKGLYKQSIKLLDKCKKQALQYEQLTIALEIVEFEKEIETLNITRSGIASADKLSAETTSLCNKIDNSNLLSNISIQLYGLYLKLGYIRSERDLHLVIQFFKPKLRLYNPDNMGFAEQLHYFQAKMWYSYIQHDFISCFKHSKKVISLFDNRKDLRALYYDQLMKGYSRYMETLFMTHSYHRLVDTVELFENTLMEEMRGLNEHAVILSSLIYYTNKINIHFMEGTFEEGVDLVPKIEQFIERYGIHVDVQHSMSFYYKIGCLYFGKGDFKKSISYLQRIINTKDVNIRRDLQCFARILNLIASYEAGEDDNIESQIRSVFQFIVKMNDMHGVQREMINFLKRLNYIYASDLKKELVKLYEKMKPFEQHPYERRPFFYLDIISWLESKINNIPVQQIIKQKFKARYGV